MGARARLDPSLRLTLSAFVLLPVLLLLAVGGWLALASLERQTMARMQEDVRLVAETLRRPLAYSLELGRLGTVESALLSARRLGPVYGIYVYDRDGERVASVGTRRGEISTEDVRALADDGERTADFEELGGEEMFSYFQPLTDAGGQIIGLLQVTRRGEDFDAYLTRLRLGALGLLLLTGMLMTGIMLLGHHRAVGRHVRGMREAMRRVAAGAYHQRVPGQGPAELRALAEGINGMLDAVERSHAELDRRRESELALRVRLARSEKMAAIGQLAAGVAHELGTPLATVDGHAQRALREQDTLPAQAREGFDSIRAEVARMVNIVRQLMDVGRRNPLDRRDVAAATLVRRALTQLPDARAGAGASAVPDIEIALPTPTPQLPVESVRSEQALVNLLDNARQAARHRVRLSWYEAGDGRGFVVEDDGPGIPSDAARHVFEPFYTTKQVGEGTGLGLAVVHSVAEAHEGEVRVDPSPLGGARFTLVLAPPADAA
ncbi:MAG: HAMP domain-containing protein [Gammaproteobacteria bacterium]|nr:HAMP domain-containing protein [Gammaproteobacteria bacterium]